MNKVMLIGRLTKDPEIRNGSTMVAKYTLAVDRAGKSNEADFIACTVFGNGAEFAQKYLKKGTKIAVEGKIRTGQYDGADGHKHYTTEVVVEKHEFVEPKKNTDAWEEVDPADVPPFM